MLKKLLAFCLSDQSKLVRLMMIASILLQIVVIVLMGFGFNTKIQEYDYCTTLMVLGFFLTVPIAFFSRDIRATLRNVGYTLLPFPIGIGLVFLAVSLVAFILNLKQGRLTNPIKLLIFPTTFMLFTMLISIVLPSVAGARILKMALEYFTKPKTNLNSDETET